MSKPVIALITAMDENQLIGKENGLPWRLPADLQFFKKVTLHKPVIMGRKTYDSIGRPLPGRLNIIITRDTGYEQEGCKVVHSIEEAVAAAGAVDEIMVIGGANVYQQFLPVAQRLYMTQVHGQFDGDAWFPSFEWQQWREAAREDHLADENNEADYSFITLEKL